MKYLNVNEDFNFDDENFDSVIDPALQKLKFYRKIVDYFPILNKFSNCIGKKIELVDMYKDLVADTNYAIYGNRIDAPNRMTKLHIGPKENPEGKCVYLAHVGFIESINLIFDVFGSYIPAFFVMGFAMLAVLFLMQFVINAAHKKRMEAEQ